MSEETVTPTVVAPLALPVRPDMRRAFDLYVFGRSRTLGPDEKGAAIPGDGTPPATGPDGDGQLELPAQRGTVAVPERLRFDRNAGTWRSK
jgi:hypothetical protein